MGIFLLCEAAYSNTVDQDKLFQKAGYQVNPGLPLHVQMKEVVLAASDQSRGVSQVNIKAYCPTCMMWSGSWGWRSYWGTVRVWWGSCVGLTGSRASRIWLELPSSLRWPLICSRTTAGTAGSQISVSSHENGFFILIHQKVHTAVL